MPTPRRPPLYVVRTSHIHGRGVFAARRYDETGMKRHHTFLFTLDRDTVIDGAISRGGGDASYVNHSCEPNCEAVITGKRIFIHALHAIEPGTELAYDYQYERTGENDGDLG